MELKPFDYERLREVRNEILDAQCMLNTMFDKDWRKKYDVSQIILCASHEFSAELLNEVRGAWKFYGTNYCRNDWAAALEEFIDIVHFSATVCECRSEEYDDDISLREGSINSYISKFFEVEHKQYHLLEKIGKKIFTDEFYKLLVLGCITFRITPEQLLVAYLHKNKKNQLRAKNGAMHREVSEIKDKEIETYDYMYENGFISIPREEYNALLDKNI